MSCIIQAPGPLWPLVFKKVIFKHKQRSHYSFFTTFIQRIPWLATGNYNLLRETSTLFSKRPWFLQSMLFNNFEFSRKIVPKTKTTITCKSSEHILLAPGSNIIFNNNVYFFLINYFFHKGTWKTVRIVIQSIWCTPYDWTIDWHKISFHTCTTQ